MNSARTHIDTCRQLCSLVRSNGRLIQSRRGAVVAGCTPIGRPSVAGEAAATAAQPLTADASGG